MSLESLSEVFPLTGTGASLVYSSHRQQGYTSSNVLRIPVSGPTLPPRLKGFEVELRVAGQFHSFKEAPQANKALTFTWNGKDGYGRVVRGRQTVKGRTGYTYEAVYMESGSAENEAAWASVGSGTPLSGSREDRTVTLWQDWSAEVGEDAVDSAQFGGLTLSMHHSYNPLSQRVSLGSGGETLGRQQMPTIQTVAGNGKTVTASDNANFGQGGPAVAAPIGFVKAVLPLGDGSFLVGEACRIRKVDETGNISAFAGDVDALNRVPCAYLGDGGPKEKAQFTSIESLAKLPDGSILVLDSDATSRTYGAHLRRISLGGVISKFAGNAPLPNGIPAFNGDGEGYARKLAGSAVGQIGFGVKGFSGDNGPAGQATFYNTNTSVPYANSPFGIGPSGEVYYVDRGSQRIRVIVTSPFARNSNEVAVASPNGNEVWTFTKNGRHLRTSDSILGIVKYTFEYSSEGLLTGVVDVDGKKLVVERDTAGKFAALVGPYGHRTAVALDANGHVASVRNSLNEVTEVAMSPSGILLEMKDARGGRHVYEYDALGRLTKDTNADGEFQQLSKMETSPSAFEVTVTTAEGRSDKYLKETNGAGELQIRTFTDGTLSTLAWPNDGSESTTAPNGTLTTVKQTGDARFGVQSPLNALTEVKLPSGLTLKMERSNAVEYVNGLASKGIAKLSQVSTVNGDTATSTYTQSDKTFRTVSAEGRVLAATVNAQGRPVAVKLPGVTDTVMDYTPLGQLATVAQGKRKLSFQYNAQGLPETVTDALGRVQKLEYNAATRVNAMTLPGQRRIQVDTDATANVTGLTPPEKQVHSMAYTSNSKLASYSPPLSTPGGQVNSTGYRYNKDGQLVEETLSGNTSVTMEYEKDKGRLASMTTSRTQVGYIYNTRGNWRAWRTSKAPP